MSAFMVNTETMDSIVSAALEHADTFAGIWTYRASPQDLTVLKGALDEAGTKSAVSCS